MLILTRRPRERIMIGPDIVLEVFQVKGDQVRIGIQAPDEVVILREEVYTRDREAHDEDHRKT